MTPQLLLRFCARIRKTILTASIIALGVVTNAAIAWSAPVAIDHLFVDEAEIYATTPFVPFPIETDLSNSLPRIITMGQYTPPPPDTTTDIFFTGDLGAPPPSGTVDGTNNSIDVDFSSLWAHVYYATPSVSVNDSIPLWDDTLVIVTNYYNPDDNSFLLEWSGSTDVDVDIPGAPLPFSVPVDYNISISGTVSTVPIPGAVWLFGTGLLGIVGVGKRFKKSLPANTK